MDRHWQGLLVFLAGLLIMGCCWGPGWRLNQRITAWTLRYPYRFKVREISRRSHISEQEAEQQLLRFSRIGTGLTALAAIGTGVALMLGGR